MELKDMTDLICVHDAYLKLCKIADDVMPDEETLIMDLGRVDRVIERNSVLYQRDQTIQCLMP